MIFCKKTTVLLFFASFISNNIDGMERATAQKTSKKNSHRPPPLSLPNKNNQTSKAKDFFSKTPGSEQNSARPKEEPKNDDSPITLEKLSKKIIVLQGCFTKLLAENQRLQKSVTALMHAQENLARKPRKKRHNKIHPAHQSATQTLNVHIAPAPSPTASVSDVE